MIRLFLLMFLFVNNTYANFEKENIKEIEEVLLKIVNKCPASYKRIDKIVFKWMPVGLEVYKPEYAFVSFFKDEYWIEFNKNKFKRLNRSQKLLNIYHEVGHVFGLKHSEGIMNQYLDNVLYSKKAIDSHIENICKKVN